MANKIQIRGAEPVGKIRHVAEYLTGGIVYPGDLVKMDNAGAVVVCVAGTAALIGVALNYAASGANVLVSDDPSQEYLIEADDGTVAAQTNLGLNYDITVGTASTLYKRSAIRLDASTGATDSNLPLRCLRLGPAVDNAFGAQADVIVKINNHQLGNAVVGL
jgi:hypothetical protein